MTSLEKFKEILITYKVQVPEESLEVFRDLVDIQSDVILDQWLADKESIRKTGVK